MPGVTMTPFIDVTVSPGAQIIARQPFTRLSSDSATKLSCSLKPSKVKIAICIASPPVHHGQA